LGPRKPGGAGGTLGWALTALCGAIADVLVVPSVFVAPNSFD
jgi:hypothetical protein